MEMKSTSPGGGYAYLKSGTFYFRREEFLFNYKVVQI